MVKNYLCFVTGILLAVMCEMSSCRSGFCAPTWQQLNQLMGCRLCFFFQDDDFGFILFYFRLFDGYHALHMFFSFAKKPPLYKMRNYSSASVPLLVIIFFQHFEIYSQIYRYCYQGLDSCAWFTEVGLVQPAGGHPVNCEQLAQITYDL